MQFACHFNKPFTLAFALIATFALTQHLAAQDPPDDEAHAQVRQKIAESKRKPAPKEKGPISRDAEAERSERKKDKSDKKADETKSDDEAGDKKAEEKKSEDPAPSITHGSVKIDGQKIRYTATAGKMVMKTDEGDPKAHVFYVAYTKRPNNDKFSRDPKGERSATKKDAASKTDPTRPITFVFNGGPGSSSVWLHLGMLGPKRVKLDSDAKQLPPPHQIIPNHYSLLDKTDLVFIDPVSTGFSRPAKGEDKKQFHGYDEDLRSVAQFIHDFTTKHGRWNSPKFLIGESYGGLRAAGLSGELQDRYHMYLNGIVLVSAVVDFQTLMTGGNNDVAYALFLPTYATTAWYHKQLSDELQGKSVEEIEQAAEKFALGPYLRALAAGDSMSDEQREEVVARMADLTGLSKDYIEASNLRIPMYRFGKELLRDDGKIVGRFDSRYTGDALDRVGAETDYDPSASAVFGTFTSALNDYLRGTLKVKEDRVYEILTGNVHPWDYSEFANRFVNASSTLRDAMTQNPYLRVFAAAGYYDLATPPTAMKHTRDHLNLAPHLRDHFTMAFYEGGHMMYTHEPSLKKLREDLVKFYDETLEPVEGSNDEGE
ncbi:MAG: peptidase S10 [Pirellulales bacterium]|nr:peptidase S10 [Pirellulales bacterium]